MSPRPRVTRDWTLQQEAFDRLLAALDPDRDRAAEEYERLRRKLTQLFRWRGCDDAEDLADETMDRVARRLGEGETIRADNPAVYLHGVAMNVLRERWRDPAFRRESESPDDRAADVVDLDEARARADADAAEQMRLDCLDDCIGALTPEHRRLLIAYHDGDAGGRIAGRQQLAAALGVPMNALRIRVFRIRTSVASCVTRCVGRKSIGALRTSE